MTQEVVPHLKAAGGGAIVNINSMIHKKPLPYQAAYATSKGALEAATKMLARELGAHKIRVNSVFMGWMWGPPVAGYVSATAQEQGVAEDAVVAGITKDIALGIIPDDADCANAVAFLCSDYAKVISGAGLDVNGGEFMP
jgi:NAD(P)-dependent dehydrogenase (short-subunit alcohol dehydrogenase family)